MARIRSAKPEFLDSILAAEVRGFFYGEGCLDMANTKFRWRGPTPRARVSLRADDLPTLKWLRSLMGGSLFYREGKGRAQPSWTWQLTNRDGLAVLLHALLSGGMPSRKRKEAYLLAEAVKISEHRGNGVGRSRLSDEQVARLFVIRDELRALRQYAEEPRGAHQIS